MRREGVESAGALTSAGRHPHREALALIQSGGADAPRPEYDHDWTGTREIWDATAGAASSVGSGVSRHMRRADSGADYVGATVAGAVEAAVERVTPNSTDRLSDPQDALPAPMMSRVEGPSEEQAPAADDDRARDAIFWSGWGFVALAALACGFGAAVVHTRSKSEAARPSGTLADPAAASIPAKVLCAYCAPSLATTPMPCVVFSLFLLSFYERRGAELGTLTLAVARVSCLDIFLRPLAAYWSDSSKYKLGRRRAFILAGAPVFGLFFYGAMSPPYTSAVGLAAWLSVMLVGYHVGSAIAVVPYEALGPELSDSPDQRLKVSFGVGVADLVGTFLLLWLPIAGFRLCKLFGVNNSICPLRHDLIRRCARGETCSLFTPRGPGHEFRVNSTFVHLLAGYESELMRVDCDNYPHLSTASFMEGEAVQAFCQCTDLCMQACENADRSFGFSFAGVVLALLFLVAQHVLCRVVREQPGEGRGGTLVPAFFRLSRNPVWGALWPAWALDAFGHALLLTMAPYFVMYVVAPEYAYPEASSAGLDCKEGSRAVTANLLYEPMCNTMAVLGGCVFAGIAMALVVLPAWFWAAKLFGKAVVWRFWSLISGVCALLFLVVGKFQLVVALVVFGISGISLGGRFLTDAVLYDAIAYDEFLTGSQHQSSYTMFRSMLPKLMVVPAASLSLFLVNIAGHQPPVDGRLQYQPLSVRMTIKLTMSIGASALFLAAFFRKRRLPISTGDASEALSKAAREARGGGENISDPISQTPYTPPRYTEEEYRKGVNSLEHFMKIELIEAVAADPEKGIAALYRSTAFEVSRDIVIWLLAGGSSCASVGLLRGYRWNWVPVLLSAIWAISTAAVCVSAARWRAAAALTRTRPEPSLVARVLAHRRALQAMQRAPGAKPPPAAARAPTSRAASPAPSSARASRAASPAAQPAAPVAGGFDADVGAAPDARRSRRAASQAPPTPPAAPPEAPPRAAPAAAAPHTGASNAARRAERRAVHGAAASDDDTEF